MKKLLAAAAVAATFVVATDAALADGYARPGLKDPGRRCASFHGFYAGANAGWAYHDANWVDRNAWVDNFSIDWTLGSVGSTRDGGTVGAQAGYNWQRGCTVFGLEIDANWTGLDSTKVYDPQGFGNPATRLTLSHDLQWFSTLRTRSGLVVDNLLLYVTGGLAYAKIQSDFAVTDPNVAPLPTREAFSISDNRWGWVGGVGAEWALSNSISIKSEVLYVRFSEESTTGLSPNGNTVANPAVVAFDQQDSMWVSRLGINFRFGCGTAC